MNGKGNIELLRDLAGSVERSERCSAQDVAALVVLVEDAMGEAWMKERQDVAQAEYGKGWKEFVRFTRDTASLMEAQHSNATEEVAK